MICSTTVNKGKLDTFVISDGGSLSFAFYNSEFKRSGIPMKKGRLEGRCVEEVPKSTWPPRRVTKLSLRDKIISVMHFSKLI